MAGEQFSLVLSIEPENADAQAGLLRAQRLPEVLALVREGDDLERSGDLEEAVRAYREAVVIDGLGHRPGPRSTPLKSASGPSGSTR